MHKALATAKVGDDRSTAGPVLCDNCGQEQDAAEISPNFECQGCGQQICVFCGCTDYSACPGGCYWIEPGRCSSCEDM